MNWRLDPAKSGLLVVDVQEKLLPAILDHERILKKIIQAVREACELGLPVFVTEQVPDKLGATVPSLRGALGSVTALAKSEFSAAKALPPDLPKSLLVCGLETHVCVRQSVYDLRMMEKTVYVLADAVGSRALPDHQFALQEMQSDKVLVASVEAVFLEMLGSAQHPSFKKILEIIR